MNNAVIRFKSRYGFNSFDKTVPLYQIGFHIARQLLLPRSGELFAGGNLEKVFSMQFKHQKKLSLSTLRIPVIDTDTDVFVAGTKKLDKYIQSMFTKQGKKYTVLPVGEMLTKAVNAGYTFVQTYQIFPISPHKDHRGRRMYLLIHKFDNRAILIEDWLDSKHAARLYFSYLTEGNFRIYEKEFAPILWHQEAVLNHQYQTQEYMLRMFDALLHHHQGLQEMYSLRTDKLSKKFGISGQPISDLLKKVFALRCKNVGEMLEYALKLPQNPNFQSFDWVAKQYAIRHMMISGKVFGKTPKGDWKFDKPLWGNYSEMDRKLNEVFDSFMI